MGLESLFTLEWRVDSTDGSYISTEFYNKDRSVYCTFKQDGEEITSCTLSADNNKFTLPAILWDKAEETGVKGSLSLEYSDDIDDNPNRVYLCGDMRIRIDGTPKILPWDKIIVYSF